APLPAAPRERGAGRGGPHLVVSRGLPSRARGSEGCLAAPPSPASPRARGEGHLGQRCWASFSLSSRAKGTPFVSPTRARGRVETWVSGTGAQCTIFQNFILISVT